MSELAIDRSRPVQRIELDPQGRSWVDLSHEVVKDPGSLLHRVISDTRWSQGEIWRYERYIEERRLGASLKASEMPPAVRQLGVHLEARYGVRFTGVTAILYRDGEDFQGLHSDRNLRWLDDTLIAILVLGAHRPFRLRPRGGWNDPAARADTSRDIDLFPGGGSLLVMGGRCQQDWLHGVPRAEVSEPRVSLTWRWTSRRGRPDTGPGYRDGRHYSDRPTSPGFRARPARPQR